MTGRPATTPVASVTKFLGTRPLRGIEDGLPAEREAHGPGQQLTDIVQPQLSLRLLRRAGNREVSDALSEGVPDAVCA